MVRLQYCIVLFVKYANTVSEDDNNMLPGAAGDDVHGTKRFRTEPDGDKKAPPDVKQGRSRNRTRRRGPRNAQPAEVDILPHDPMDEGGVDITEPTESEVVADAVVVKNDELDSDFEEEEEVEEVEDNEEGENEEQKPREPTAAMKKKLQTMATQMRNEAGDIILSLEPNQLIPSPLKVIWDEDDTKLLCSYNWSGANDGTNTIFVPGGPAKFRTNKTTPRAIRTDEGFQARDYNYVRKPRDPFSPLFTALGVMSPGYQFWDVDVLADRNNLRILLEFVQGKANGPLRLDVYLIYNTLIFVRKGERFWQRQKMGIGSNFEKMFTDAGDGMEDATGHYRAIRYGMGSLQVVVRFEADAYFDEEASDDLAPSEADAVKGALLADRPRFDYRPPVQLLQKGHIVPMTQMAELKTVTYKMDGMDPVKCQDQLWFGRTPHLFTGIYRVEKDGKGQVLRVRYENAKERVRKWEEKNQDSLRKLVDLLTKIRAALKQQPGPIRAGVLVREGRDSPLVLRTMLRKQHIIGREFFQAHWVHSRSSATRNHQNQGRPFQQHGTRGYRGQMGGMRNNYPPPHLQGYAAYNTPQQQHPGGYGGGRGSGSYGGYGNAHAQQSGFGRGGGNRGGRGSGYSRGHNQHRGRGGNSDSNYRGL